VLFDVLAWMATAAITFLAISHFARATWVPLLYVLQALTVPAGCFSFALAVASLLTGRPVLAGANAVLAVVLAWVVLPLTRVHREPPRSPIAQVATLTVLHANTYYGNRHVDRAAEVIAEQATQHDVDVIVISEYPPELETTLIGLLGRRYPYTAGASSTARDGLGLLSRLPINNVQFEDYLWEPALELRVAGIRVIVVHPGTGMRRRDLREWNDDIDHIADRAASAGPATLVIGDFNATRWHPPFRAFLDRGFSDVHERLGRGFSTSWPVSRWRPRFVRLDHALVDRRLTPLSVTDFRIPGSDHTGFVTKVGISERRVPR